MLALRPKGSQSKFWWSRSDVIEGYGWLVVWPWCGSGCGRICRAGPVDDGESICCPSLGNAGYGPGPLGVSSSESSTISACASYSCSERPVLARSLF